MGIAVTTQDVILHMNTLSKSISYRGVIKYFDDKSWDTDIIPLLYPLWHSDRDKLEVFTSFKSGAYQVTRNKYTRRQGEATGKWVSYEFPYQELDTDAAESLTTALIEKYIDYKETIEKKLADALQTEFVEKTQLSWDKVRLVRNFLLQDSDWTQLADAPITDGDEKQMWQTYRDKLRNIPFDSYGSPWDVKFPITPTEYIARESYDALPEAITDKYGTFGHREPYLNSSEYHLWQPSVHVINNWRQRMAFYMLLRMNTLDDITMAGLLQRNQTRSHGFDPYGRENDDRDSYIDDLLNKIQAGEI